MIDYRVVSETSGEDESSIEAHVLARAYRAVWRCTYGTKPAGQHQIARLQIVIDFGSGTDKRAGNPGQQAADLASPGATGTASPDLTSTGGAQATSTCRCHQSASAAADVAADNVASTDLWARVRQFGKRMPWQELELMIADLREQDRLRHADSEHGANCRNRRRDD
jgi:hypothetical protein